jgi:ribosome biogenesis protein MAK21
MQGRMTEMTVQDNKARRRRGKRNGGSDDTKNAKGKQHDKTTNHSGQSSTRTSVTPISDKQPSLSYKPHNTLLVQFTEQTPTWYECGRNTSGRDDVISAAKSSKSNNTREIVNKYRQLADEIFAHEVTLSRNTSTSHANSEQEKDEKWVENTMKRGTLKDRIAAMSVVASMDCIHKLYALDMLLDLAGCGVNNNSQMPNSRIGQMASEALSDLFINTLLPRDRKLISLEQRPLYQYEKKTLSPRILLLWRYEEMMKIRYASYLQRYLGRTLGGDDELSKKNALMTASTLLKEVPEGEEVLLTLIVNKIGDPARKIASAAGHQLRGVLEEHPVMVNVVAREVSFNCSHLLSINHIHDNYLLFCKYNHYTFRFNNLLTGHIYHQEHCTIVSFS